MEWFLPSWLYWLHRGSSPVSLDLESLRSSAGPTNHLRTASQAHGWWSV